MPSAERSAPLPSRRSAARPSGVRDALLRGRSRAGDYAYALRQQARGARSQAAPAAFSRGDRRPVLLLPGILEPWTMLLPVAERLNADGHPIHLLPGLALNVTSVPDASALARAELVRRDLREVILVAHSKGGLIGKHLLLHDEDRRLDRLIAVATPFHGSSLARLLPAPSIIALGPDDPTILALAAEVGVNHRITSIYPAHDPHIPEGSRLDGATNIPVACWGHFRVLADREVLDAVATAAR